MDTKMKIIILVFTVVVVFYLFQFIFKMMQKKEHFSANYYDDVEGFEDAPEKEKYESKDEEYDLRISLLNEIDKLEITNNKVKGSVMESVFSEVSMTKMKSMSPEKRKEEIRNIYQAAVNQASPAVTQETAPVVTNPSTSTVVKSMFENAPPLPTIQDYNMNDARNKTMQAVEKLESAIESLKDMKNILQQGGNIKNKEPYIPDLPIPPMPKKEFMEEEEPEVKAAATTPLIEGFENVPSYASCL